MRPNRDRPGNTRNTNEEFGANYRTQHSEYLARRRGCFRKVTYICQNVMISNKPIHGHYIISIHFLVHQSALETHYDPDTTAANKSLLCSRICLIDYSTQIINLAQLEYYFKNISYLFLTLSV